MRAAFDLVDVVELSSSDAGTTGLDRALPRRALQVLLPERPRRALLRTHGVDRAAVVGAQERASRRVRAQRDPAIVLGAVARQELGAFEPKERRDRDHIALGQVDEGVVPVVPAAVAALCAAEAQPTLVPA